MQEVLTIDFRRPVPVFPLPDCVLFPHTLLPLHIFEPRYRQLVTEALDDVGLIAMGLFEGTVSEEEYLRGSPKLRPWVCVGLVRSYEKSSDGRFVLLVQGICRARLLKEVPHEPYRTFTVEPADTMPQPDDTFGDFRDRIASLVQDAALDGVAAIKKAREHLEAAQPVVAMIDNMLSELVSDSEERYTMLAETDATARAQWLVEYMETLRDRAAGSSP